MKLAPARRARLIRAQNLRRLIDDRYNGVAARLAREVGVQPSYINSILSGLRGRRSSKPLTADMAERLELAVGLPLGSLSHDHERDHAPLVAGADASNRQLIGMLLSTVEAQGEGLAAARRAIESLQRRLEGEEPAERTRQASAE